jgi:hypothetical protein
MEGDAEVDPPVGAAAAGPTDDRGIDGAGAVALKRLRGGVTLPKPVGNPAQPLLGGAQPLEQGYRRDLTPTGLLGAGDGLLEGTATGEVDQQGSQQDGGIGNAAGAPQRTRQESLLLPSRREELADQRPVIQLGRTCIGVHPQTNTVSCLDSQALS